MNAKKAWLAIVLAVLFIGYPQQSSAKEFTSAELLSWQKNRQDGYFQVSVTMASFISAQNNPRQAKCLDDWYFGENMKERNTTIRETLVPVVPLPVSTVPACLQSPVRWLLRRC